MRTGDEKMSVKITLACLYLLIALNLAALVVSTSLPIRAASTYQDLIKDPNFTQAVQIIVEKCRVNVDIARVQC
jgi:hypothetical protein